MFARSSRIRLAAVFAGTLVFLGPIGLISTARAGSGNGSSQNGPSLVAYGCAHETQEMFRYEFATDTYKVIGVVTDQFGKVCVEMGSMAFIP